MEIERSDSDSGGINAIKSVFTLMCVHCKKPFEHDTVVVAVGYPHHIMLHHRCAPFYPYSEGYAFVKPWEYYVNRTKRMR